LEPRTILVVDDDDEIREMIRVKLEACGHTIVTAANGAQGMKVMELLTFDVVITDVVMPIRDGLELIAAARCRHDTTPIIAISGDGRRGTAGYLHSARGLGADLVLKKPFSLSELTAAIHLVAEP
jgi:DNA-binding response OmpR family regulator